ncbi:iron-siderophore ABC transporter substrate-binding protein [Paenibacillus sp. IB182496]|uniref:Iron-siderophore ABC transporter substrate-binding protein n=1 Tax=Paenibacillus sabuli TaxID=2772509 RepID=A0A927BTJ9_9BACL|nr:iron-siderophore ABC transporter substrate-binding protein [Paenibacillus sabuli]MBD2846537.1 iron-siderophore ABC transporter substrate-binding protein [Paenibacillus sabuli]
MKRSWSTVGMVILIAALLAACGAAREQGTRQDGTTNAAPGGVTNEAANDSGAPAQDEQTSTDGREAAETTKEQTTATQVLETVMGDVAIPVEPERVIGLSVVYPELLYALGVVPVAVQNYHDEFPSYLGDGLADTLKMGIDRTPDFEAILSADPDLILAPAWWSEKDYDQLSSIAPTVLLPQRDDWRDELRDIAAVFGKEAQAATVIAELQAKTDEAAAQLDELIGDETVLYMRIMAKEIVVHGPSSARGKLIHEELGLAPVPQLPQAENARSISLEVLPEYDADHFIIQLDDESSEEVQSQFERMLSSALWDKLTAVQQDHLYMVEGKDWFNVGMSPLADSAAIDTVVEALEHKQP